MRKRIALTAIVGVTAITATAQAATKTVSVGDNWFAKERGVPTVAVKAGDTVRFRWVGERDHNVSVQSGPAKFRSPIKDSGTFSKKVTKRGTYLLICTVHGRADQSMRLRVR